MKLYKLIFLLGCVFSCKAQESKYSSIITQDFHYKTDQIYTNSNSDIIFFQKVYSSKKMNFGNIAFNDSIEMSKISIRPDKYSYYLKMIFSKDTIQKVYFARSYTLVKEKNTNDYQPLIFKHFNEKRLNFFCNEIKYENINLFKEFISGNVLVSADEEYTIKILGEDCQVIEENKYIKNELKFCVRESFLALKYKDYFIFIFD